MMQVRQENGVDVAIVLSVQPVGLAPAQKRDSVAQNRIGKDTHAIQFNQDGCMTHVGDTRRRTLGEVILTVASVHQVHSLGGEG